MIGGGVIGVPAPLPTARGWQVTLVERATVGSGSSHANCGFICPSHILPLAEPGMVMQGLKSLFARNSPFAIKLRLDPALWSWLLHFAARCNERDMIAAGRGIHAALDPVPCALPRVDRARTARLRIRIAADALRLPLKTRDGSLRGNRPPDDRSIRLYAQRCDGTELLALEPALCPGLAGGWFHHDDAHLRPDKLMQAWRQSVAARGAIIHENCPFESFVSRNGQATAAVTPRRMAAELFVLATGAWTPLLNLQLGCKVPIQPGKGYSITMPRPAVCPRIPLIFPETRVAVTPFQSGYRLGSTMEFAGYDESIRPERLQLLKDGSADYLQEPYCEPVLEKWFGWRPMTYDSLPIIDRSPIHQNVFIAAGHNMLGLSMATATGKLIAELASGKTPHVDPGPYRLSRF